MLAGEIAERIHVGEPHGQMHGQQRFGTRCYRLPGGFNIQAISIRIDIGENRHAAGKQHRRSGPIPGVGRHDHFIAESNTGRLQRGHQRDGPVCQTQSIFRAVQFGETRGELAAVTAGHRIPAPVAAFEHLLQPLRVGGKILRPDRERPATYRTPAQNCQFTHMRTFS